MDVRQRLESRQGVTIMDWDIRDNWPLWAMVLAGPALALAGLVATLLWIAYRLGRAAGRC